MYAVIKTGGKQYRVKAGDLLVVEKLDGEPGDKVAFDQVLMLGEGADVVVGAPTVEGASVSATLIETRKGEKVKIFKKIRRQGYRRTRGHRQLESVFRVTAVAGAGKSETWDGEVNLTPKAVLDARARNLRHVAEALEAAAAPTTVKKPEAKLKAAPKTEAKAETAAPAETAAADAEAPKPARKAAAPKAKAEASETKAAAPKKAPARKSASKADE